MGKINNIIGKRFGRLVVVSQNGRDNYDSVMWLCKCDCGNTVTIRSNSLIRGASKSCGCYKTDHPTYGNRKYDINIVRKSFEDEGYILLTTDYINSKQKLRYICSVGHEHTIDWGHWNLRGHRCPICKAINIRGKNHWNWQGGKVLFSRRVRNFVKTNDTWFQDVLDRDNYVCQHCGSGGYLEAHHLIAISKIINYYNLFTIDEVSQCDLLFDINNGLTLCLDCHTWVHSKRNINKEYLHGF